MAACVCGLALPVLPAGVAFVPGACPSQLAGPSCATATGLHATCHEAFAEGGGDDFCITNHGQRSTFGPPADQGGSRGSSFPIRPRARAFHALYPEATGAVSATSTAVGPLGSIVGGSGQAHLRLTAPFLTNRLLVLRWHGGGLPDGASTQLRVTAGERVLLDDIIEGSAAVADQAITPVAWQGDLDLAVSALATARRDLSVASADLAWRLAVLDPTADDDVDATANARDPAPLDRTVPGEPPPSTRPRVLLIGLDGAGWDVLDPLIDAGYLPTIGALVRGGAWAKLDETGNGPDCCYCPPVWSSIATGQSRVAHHMGNVFDEPHDRPVPAIWTVLAANGGTTTQVSYRNTFPVEPGVTYVVSEPGLVVAGDELFDVQAPYAVDDALDRLELTWPPRLFETLGVLPASVPGPQAWIPFAIDRTSVEALARLAATSPTDLTMWILHSIDKSEHLMFGTVQSPGAPTNVDVILNQAARWIGPVTGPCCTLNTGFWWGDVASQYLEAEQHVARILAAARYDYVLFASDHSMAANPGAGIPGIHWIPPTFDGIFAISGPGIVPGLDLGSVSLLDVAPTLAYLLDLPVADDLPGTVLT
ncbi:MAG: alkaline phosphatase family protein, partial [Actinomycetota bacterium]